MYKINTNVFKNYTFIRRLKNSQYEILKRIDHYNRKCCKTGIIFNTHICTNDKNNSVSVTLFIEDNDIWYSGYTKIIPYNFQDKNSFYNFINELCKLIKNVQNNPEEYFHTIRKK